MNYVYKTHGTCAKMIAFEINGGTVTNVKFMGGCPGNLLAIPKLVEGMKAEEIVKKLGGVDCDGKGTSCADQLSKAVAEAYLAEKNGE